MDWLAFLSLTSFADRLKDVTTFFGLLISHTARAIAAAKNSVDGTMVKTVSSKSRVKSKLLLGPV
jgi:hypothetical protein